jgi:hypothetical protein
MSDVNVFLLIGKLIIFSAANLPFFWLGYCEFKIRYIYSVTIAAFLLLVLPFLYVELKRGPFVGDASHSCHPFSYCLFDLNHALMPVAQFFIGIFLHFQRKSLAALPQPKRYAVLAFEWLSLTLVASFAIAVLPAVPQPHKYSKYADIYESYPLTGYVDYVGKMFDWP